MDKIMRLLLLHSKLISGELINKTLFCFENECSPRTFDRDIEVIRTYLSESFSFTELKYDRGQNCYFIEGTKREFLEPMEYLFLEQLLQDSSVLRKDEFEILLGHLLENTESENKLKREKESVCKTYRPPVHNKALLKMHGDLVRMIREKKCIGIRYEEGDGRETYYELLPCEVIFDQCSIYLTGFYMDTEEEIASSYLMDRIISFEILRSQNEHEQNLVKDYCARYAGNICPVPGEPYIEIEVQCTNNFYQSVLDQFPDTQLVRKKPVYCLLKIRAVEDEFIEWVFRQPAEEITILSPESTVRRIKELAELFLQKYGGIRNEKKNIVSTDNG